MEGKLTLSLFYMGLVSAVIAIALTAVTFYGMLQEQIKDDLLISGNTIATAYNDSEDLNLSVFENDKLRLTLNQRGRGCAV